jgi:hypothetical protein
MPNPALYPIPLHLWIDHRRDSNPLAGKLLRPFPPSAAGPTPAASCKNPSCICCRAVEQIRPNLFDLAQSSHASCGQAACRDRAALGGSAVRDRHADDLEHGAAWRVEITPLPVEEHAGVRARTIQRRWELALAMPHMAREGQPLALRKERRLARGRRLVR